MEIVVATLNADGVNFQLVVDADALQRTVRSTMQNEDNTDQEIWFGNRGEVGIRRIP